MQKGYFVVTAKCGHVGKQFFYKGTFYIRAFTMSEAAAIARYMPRVKHDHKDAILCAEEISGEAYEAGKEAIKSEAYFQCVSQWQHRLARDEISPKLYPETELVRKHRQRVNSEKEELELKVKQRYKRERFVLREEDFEIISA